MHGISDPLFGLTFGALRILYERTARLHVSEEIPHSKYSILWCSANSHTLFGLSLPRFQVTSRNQVDNAEDAIDGCRDKVRKQPICRSLLSRLLGSCDTIFEHSPACVMLVIVVTPAFWGSTVPAPCLPASFLRSHASHMQANDSSANKERH